MWRRNPQHAYIEPQLPVTAATSVATLVITLMTLLAGAVLVAAPAQAATVTFIQNGITYTADNSNPGAGAGVAVTAYDGSSPSVVIPDTVTLDGTMYNVTIIGSPEPCLGA